MADIVGSSTVARTVNLTRSTIAGSVFGMRSGVSGLSPIRPVQPREELVNPNQGSFNVISNQLSALTAQMNDIGGALERIAFYISQDSSLDQLQAKQSQEQERRLAEEGARTQQESVIERKIKASLISPIQIVAERTQSVLSNLMRVFGVLFGGWLVNKGIETLKNIADGNVNKLEEIKNSVIKNIGIALGTLFVIKGGFFTLVRTLGSITLNMAKSVAGLLFLKPFKFIGDLVKGTIKNVLKPVAAAVPKPVTSALSSMRGVGETIMKGAKNVVKGAGNFVVGGALTALDIAGGEDPGRAIAGAAGGMITSTAAFGLGSAIPLPGTGLLAGGLAYGPGEKAGKGVYDMVTGNKPETKNKTVTDAKVNPTVSKTPSVKPPTNSNLDKSSTSTMVGLVDSSIPSSATQTISSPQPVRAISPSKKTVTNEMVGPLPEVKPTIIMAKTSSDQSASPSNQTSSVGGSANSVPAISSSNPENFYTLYSQINYNVVI